MDGGDLDSRQIKTTTTVFGIIEYIQNNEQATLGDITDSLDKAKSTVHAHLTTLENHGYLIREDDTYRLGLRFLNLGMAAKNRYGKLNQLAKPVLEQLADETGEAVWLFVEEQGLGIYLECAIGEHSIHTVARIGQHRKLHTLAAGKSILAHLPETRIDEIIEHHGLPERTEYTITDPDALKEDLARTRERGYAYNEDESIVGISAVGAPVLVDGSVAGAISVAAPTNRLKGDRFTDALPNLVLGAANEIEIKLAYS